jgi:hypothetical protein
VQNQDHGIVTISDINQPDKIRKVHVSRCRLYIEREGEDIHREAVRGNQLYILDEILSHRFINKAKRLRTDPRNVEVQVKWRGYETLDRETLANASIRDSVAFVRYAQDKDDLKIFIRRSLDNIPPS